jgi:hypothetical protein
VVAGAFNPNCFFINELQLHAVGERSPHWGVPPQGWPPPPTMDRPGTFFIYCGDPEIFFVPSRGDRLPSHPVLSGRFH